MASTSKTRALLQLIRFDKPIGTLLLLWPTLWALWIAARGVPDYRLLVIFIGGTFLTRSAGCIVNDLADRRVDGAVKRTSGRPLVTGAVTEKEAIALFSVLMLLATRGKQYSLPLPHIAQLTLPLVGRVAAGAPILAQEHIDQTYLMEASLFTRRPDYLLKVRGMSMRDAGIMDGDLLAVQKGKEVKNGQIVVARLGDEVTVKRFRKTKAGIELIPENPDFETLHVAPDDESFELEGLAVGLIRNTMLM